jgi:futalosine hydrolase
MLIFAGMKIMLAAATEAEIFPILQNRSNMPANLLCLVTGVGMLAAGIRITKAIHEHRPHLIIQAGIAGAFDATLIPGMAVLVKEETLPDLGVKENGEWKDLFDLGLARSSDSPFQSGKLVCSHAEKLNYLNLRTVPAVTVNEISTDRTRINQVLKKYRPAIESMEGAALHFSAILENIPFLQIRTISNYVGERDKSKWAVKEAIAVLNKTTTELIHAIIQKGL